MRIEVTQDRINRGISNDCDRCAVAIAVEETVGCHAEVVEVIRLIPLHSGEVVEVEMNAETREFIRKFDKGEPVEPFSFELPSLPPDFV